MLKDRWPIQADRGGGSDETAAQLFREVYVIPENSNARARGLLRYLG
jgi:hypothetical protein